MKKIYGILLLILGFTVIAIQCSSKQEEYQLRTIAFYNLENLFDTEDDFEKLDEKSPMMKITRDRDEIYNKKLNHLAKVIADIGSEHSKSRPSILGVAEVENRSVLEDLLNSPLLKDRNYEIIHYDSPDLRGIDVALIYQPTIFRPIHHEVFELKLWSEKGGRIYTRDQLLVSGYLDDELIHLIVNHWPSRRGGEARSSKKREKAAYLNQKIIAQIRLSDANAKVLIMGDFNDNPTNKSFKKVLNTKKNMDDVEAQDIYNPYEKKFGKGFNTLVYRDQLHLFDQILYTAPLVSDKEFNDYKVYKSAIFRPSYLTTKSGKYKGYPHRSFSGSRFINGYSDHYPVYVQLIRKLKTQQ
jgi:predicted extracellular nuclease